jgi:hypothetical protein
MDGGSSYFTVKRNVTIGCSYTFGMGNGASNMVIDSNWAEWQNYWVSNDGVGPGANGMIVTNMFFTAPPQDIIDRAGVHEDEVIMTPVSIKPVQQFSGLSGKAKHGYEFMVYNTRGQLLSSFPAQDKLAAAMRQSPKKLPAGTYIVKGSENMKNTKRIIITDNGDIITCK